MKTTMLLVFLLVVSTAMFGQYGGVAIGGGQQGPFTNPYVMPDHPEHASQHAMATEHPLVGGGTVTYAQGEQPLWQFGSKVERPLGDVAREYRKLALYGSEKARIYWEKQGGK